MSFQVVGVYVLSDYQNVLKVRKTNYSLYWLLNEYVIRVGLLSAPQSVKPEPLVLQPLEELLLSPGEVSRGQRVG